MHNNIASTNSISLHICFFSNLALPPENKLLYMKCWVREAELRKNVDDKETDLSFPGHFSFMTALTHA